MLVSLDESCSCDDQHSTEDHDQHVEKSASIDDTPQAQKPPALSHL